MDTIVSLAIAGYVLWAWVSTGPPGSVGLELLRPIDRIMWWLGLTHGWAMYSPDPAQCSRWIRAYVTFADGSRAVWEAPRICELGKAQAFLRMRHSRYQDALCHSRHRSLRPAFCEYLSRRLSLPAREAIGITLVCVEQRVPPPAALNVVPPVREIALCEWQTESAAGAPLLRAVAAR